MDDLRNGKNSGVEGKTIFMDRRNRGKRETKRERKMKNGLTIDSGMLEGDKYLIIHSSCVNGQLGTGFTIKKELQYSILNYQCINERITTIRVKGRFFNITIISVHAPTEEKREENAKIGREEVYHGVIGRNIIHENSNNNGKRVVDLASGHNMIVATTVFPHKRIHLGSWISPDGNTVNQIDHILIDRRHATDITDARSYRGADCSTDHYLVRASYRQKISIKPRSGRAISAIRYEVESLKQKEFKIKYQEVLEQNLIKAKERRQRPRYIEERWEDIRSSVIATAAEVLGSSRKRRRNSWFDMDCRDALEERRNPRLKLIQNESENNIEDFKEKRRLASKLCKTKKREWLNAKLKEMEENRRTNEIRKFYMEIREEKKWFQPKIGFCKEKRGELIVEKNEILDRRAEYFEVLLNEEVEYIQVSNGNKIKRRSLGGGL
ncbi:uncharacterized protein [Centruroides vittatus]|uniref:uncharacterized protein n=1 Tax=Centruroides vittatus TaxID=120091 RepID=UPI00350FE1C8